VGDKVRQKKKSGRRKDEDLIEKARMLLVVQVGEIELQERWESSSKTGQSEKDAQISGG